MARFLGVTPVSGEHFHERLWHLIQILPQLNWATTGLAILSLLLVLYAPRLKALSRLPGPLVAMLVATCLPGNFHFPGVETLGTAFGGIPRGLPAFNLPDLSLAHMIGLIGPAFTIALLGAIESLLCGGRRRRNGRNPPRFQSGADRPRDCQPGVAALRRLRRNRCDRADRDQHTQRRHQPACRYHPRTDAHRRARPPCATGGQRPSRQPAGT